MGKPCLAGVAPTLPSPFIVTAAAAGSHTAGTTLNPGLESAQSPLCLPIGGGGCTQLETGGEVWVEFFLSDPRNVTRGREADSHQRFHREEIKPSVHREKERRRVQQQSEEVRS